MREMDAHLHWQLREVIDAHFFNEADRDSQPLFVGP